jgi:hypothetical protein
LQIAKDPMNMQGVSFGMVEPVAIASHCVRSVSISVPSSTLSNRKP